MKLYSSRYALVFYFILFLVSCGKTKDSANANKTSNTSPVSKESFLNSKYIQVLCKSEDNSSHETSYEVLIASPQDNLEKVSAYFSTAAIPTGASVDSSTVENIVTEKTENTIKYSAKDYSLFIDLLSKVPTYKFKGTVHYISNELPEDREVSCLVEDLE